MFDSKIGLIIAQRTHSEKVCTMYLDNEDNAHMLTI
jgi:hypothetical protein